MDNAWSPIHFDISEAYHSSGHIYRMRGMSPIEAVQRVLSSYGFSLDQKEIRSICQEYDRDESQSRRGPSLPTRILYEAKNKRKII